MSSAIDTQADTAKVSIIINNYNGGDDVLDTVEAALASEGVEVEVIISDDGSTDGSLERVVEKFPQVVAKPIGFNTARLNRVRNNGIKASSHDTVMIVDNDITLAPDCVAKLYAVLHSRPDIATASPRLIFEEEGVRRVYWDGGKLHYIGASICPNRNASLDTPTRPPERNIGCGIIMMDKTKLAEIGFFDEAYWVGWGDDGEIYYRFLAAGYETMHVSEASAIHIAKQHETERMVIQLHNRWMFLLKNYRLISLILMLPALLIYEGLQFVFTVMKGEVKSYFYALGQFLKHLPAHIKWRMQYKIPRKRNDHEILTSGPLYISPKQVNKGLLQMGLKMLQGILNGYWAIIQKIV